MPDTSGYVEPTVYTQAGPVLTQLHSSINATHWSLTYRCQGCTTWGEEGGFDPAGEFALGGWSKAIGAISNPASSNAVIPEHSSFGLFGINLPAAQFAGYSEWIKLGAPSTTATTQQPSTTTPTTTQTTTATTTPTTTATTTVPTTSVPVPTTTSAPAPTGTPVPANVEYDYIIVGGGAGGLVGMFRPPFGFQ